METSTLQQILILLASAALSVGLFRRLRLPPVLAYLVVGVLVGPYGLGLIANTEDTRFLAEFGVVFLLFTVGLEFSLPQLIAMRREVLGLGGAQVVLTTVCVAGAGWLLGMSLPAASILGGVLAMSSTAIVIKQLDEQLELNSRHGRNAVGVLLFQDLAVVPFLIAIPVFAGDGNGSVLGALSWAMFKGSAMVVAMLAAGYWLLRPLLHEIAASRSAELFTLSALLFALLAAWSSHAAGLSMALGAFVAGMMLGETEFRHQIEADIRPFRDVLLGLFFITIGMELDLSSLPQVGLWVLLLVAAIVAFKLVSITALGVLMGSPKGVAMRTGLVLAQGGEFGFALVALALGVGLFDAAITQVVLGALVLSMFITPFLVRVNGRLATWACAGSYTDNLSQLVDKVARSAEGLEGHVLICGYGRIGQGVAHFVEQEDADYLALDLEPTRVREARAAGERVTYGNATHRAILEAAGLQRARVMVISFDDVHAAIKIIEQVRSMGLTLPILVRTRDDSSLERLQQAGADEVVPETLEASLMLASHLLFQLGVPMSRIVRKVQGVRGDRYKMLRAFFHGDEPEPIEESTPFRERLHTVVLGAGARAVGQALGELGLEQYGLVVTAVRRGGIRGEQPQPEMVLQAGDSLVLYGTPEDLEHGEARLLSGL